MKTRLCPLLSVVAAIGLVSSPAQTVSWDGGGDGVNWNDPLNWSGDALPGPANDVLISVPTNTVIISQDNVTVRSVQCMGGLLITNSDFAVTAGTSFVYGTLAIANPHALTALNSNTTFTANGPAAIPGGNLYASSGGQIELAVLGRHEDISINYQSRVWQANGAGSVIRLPALTNLTGATAGGFYLQCYGGGRIEFPALTTTTPGYINASADGVGSTVNMPALTNGPLYNSAFEARNGGAISIPLVTEWRDASLAIRATNSFIPTAQITSFANSSITIDAVNLTLSNVVDATLASLYVENCGRLALPHLTSYPPGIPDFQSREFRATGTGSVLDLSAITDGSGSVSSYSSLYVRAYWGGQVILTGLTTTPASTFYFWSEGSDSRVDLSNLATSPGAGSSFEARSGGTLNIPNLILATNINLTLRGTNSTIPLAQIISFANSSVTIDAVDLTLSNVVDVSLASLYVENGGRLALPHLTSYPPGIPSFQSREFRATGMGSVLDLSSLTNLSGSVSAYSSLYVRAYWGGQVILTGLTTVPASCFYFWSEGGDSQVDLSNLANSPGAGSSFEVRSGGTLNFPNLVFATNINLVVRGTDSTFPVAQVTSFANSTVTVDGVTLTLTNVTDAFLASLYVENGGRLALPSLHSYPAGIPSFQSREFRATGPGSVLDLSALTDLTGGVNSYSLLYLRAYSGGQVILTGVGTVPFSSFYVWAEGAGALVNLSSLTHSPRAGSSFEVRSSGTISIPLITRAEEINLTLRNAGILPTAQVLSLANSSITVDSTTPDFNAVTNADLASLYVENAGRLSLPGVTRYGGNLPAFQSRVWQANGAGGVLELTNLLATAHGNPGYASIYVRAYWGGRVRLDQLGCVTDSAVVFYSERDGSRIEAPALTNWSGYGAIEANLNGTIQLTTNTLITTNVHVTLRADSTNTVGELRLYDSSDIAGTGTLFGNLVNGGGVYPGYSPGAITVSNYTQLTNGALHIEIGGAAPTNGFDVLNVLGSASLDGLLDVARINGYAPPVGSTYRFLNAASRTGEFARFTGLNAGASTEFLPGYDAAGAFLTAQFSTGPVVTNGFPSGAIAGSLSFFDITFNKPIDGGSVWTNDATLTGPGGGLPLDYAWLINARTVRFGFANQTTPGAYTIIVGPNITDYVGNPMNQDGDATNGEAIADRFTNSVTLSIADLAVANVVAPPAALPGETIAVSYTIQNVGLEPVVDAHVDGVLLSTDALPGNDTLLGLAAFTQTLAPGASMSVTQLVTVPTLGPAGNLRVVVQADYNNQVWESSEANNAAVATNDTVVPFALQLQVTTNIVSETNGPLAALVSRNGSTAAPLVVNLASSDTSEITVPATVTIPAGQNSAPCNLTPIHDGVADGNQLATVTASAGGFVSASNTVLVTDVDTPRLFLTASATTLLEGGADVIVTVTRETVTSQPLTVTLASSSPSQLSTPVSVTIPASAPSAVFNVSAVDDTLVEGPRGYLLTASAGGFVPATVVFTVLNNDTPALTLTLDHGTVTEGGFVTATLTASSAGAGATAVWISNSTPSRVSAPATVTLNPGQTSATFPVSAVDNGLIDGNANVTLTAFVTETQTGTPLPPGASASLTVQDNDSPALTLRIAKDAVAEGLSPATTATVTRNTPTTNSLTVALASSNTGEATVPTSVEIPNGQTSATFDIASVNDGVTDGNKTVVITASTAGFTSGSDEVVVTDINLPDLVVTTLNTPTNSLTGDYFSVTFREVNQGLANAMGAWQTVVYLSSDPYPGGDSVLGQYGFSGSVAPGLYIERTAQFRAPLTPGNYWIIVTTDATNSIAEILENNNSAVAALPLHIDPSFTASVQTAVNTALAGTPVPMTGTATRVAGGPAQFELVSIHLIVRGTERVIAALTDASGNFSATFTPLPGEAGTYTIGAAHPGVATAPVQDSFVLLGARFEPSILVTQVVALASVTGAVNLVNLGNVPLTGLSATVLGTSADLAATASVSATLPADGAGPVQFTLSSLTDTQLTAGLTIRVTSAEGVTADLKLTNSVIHLQPQLVATSGSLQAGMLRGGQTVVSFVVQNLGGAESGPLTVLLPNLDFLHLSSSPQMASLPPGGSNTLTLQLTAATNQPFGNYAGNLVVSGTNSGVSVPFTFRALSAAQGTLVLDAVDEYTYYAAGSPHLEGAGVTVYDTVSGALATNGVTASNGLFQADLREGYYDVEVRADQHSLYRATVLVPAGATTNVQAFLARQAVQFIWHVEPTDVQDHTKIVIETVFETFVPIPVVTVEPTVIDLATVTNNVTQINLTIANHGLVAAENAQLSFGSHPDWSFTPLVNNLGTLPAQSSITVPLTIRRVSSAALAASKAARRSSSGGGPCGVAAGLGWTLKCGGHDNGYGTPISVVNAGGGNCGGYGSITPFGGWGSAAGSYFPVTINPTAVPCTTCNGKPEDVQLAVAKCLFSFFPLDCPGGIVYGAADCIISGAQNGFISSSAASDCVRDAIGAALGCGELLGVVVAPEAVALWNALNCIHDIEAAACFPPGGPPGSGGSGGGGGGGGGGGSDPNSSSMSLAKSPLPAKAAATPDLSLLRLHAERLTAIAEALTYPYGDSAWLSCPTSHIAWEAAWLQSFMNALTNGSPDGAAISTSERAALLALPLPAQLTTNQAHAMLDRWNRSLSYYAAGQFFSTNLAFGQNPDFIAMDVYQAKLAAAVAAFHANEAEGFTNATAGLFSALQQTLAQVSGGGASSLAGGTTSKAASGGVCATVRLRLEQEAVITRDGFNATLEFLNGSASALQNISVSLAVQRADTSDATSLFSISPPSLQNLNAVDGTGTVAGGQDGSATWLFIPTSDAAPGDAPVNYFVTGTLRYLQDGAVVNMPLAPALITVHPNASLRLQYFHERDVLADDPFTDAIEPSQPYSLAVMVQNTGHGTARQMHITSAQPKIVDNEKGLFINFDLIGTEVAGQNLSPSLTVDFGDVAAGQIKIGRWLFKSTLQGQFIDYSATFEHTDGLGDPRLSLIDSVDIHELIRIVKATNTLNDSLPDFLVNDFPDDQFLPDRLYLSDASIAPVSPVTSGTTVSAPSASNLTAQIQAALPAGWSYLRMADPGQGRFTLLRVVRSDGAELPPENFWVTDRTFIAGGRRPLYETNLHLLDFNSPGNYTLYYAAPSAPDTNAPSSAVAALAPASYPQIPLTWSGSDGADGSGIVSYDIYVSDNGGPFTRWLQATPLAGAIYSGASGHSYAFYSVATDHGGNREPAHVTPDAQTSVDLINQAPLLTVGADQTVDEGATVVIENSATDADVPPNTLTFSLGSGAPGGATINPATGRITWLTGEGTGPSTNLIPVIVTDNGLPSLSATGLVSVIVNEVNTAPVLAPVSPRTVNEGVLLLVTNLATDNDLPANTLRFSLGTPRPVGATLNTNTGVFSWQPTDTQGPSTNTITVVVTDNGVPSLSATQRFTVIVRDTLADFAVGLGFTNVFAGESNAVPLVLRSGADLTNFTVTLTADEHRLTNLVLQSSGAEVLASLLSPAASNQSRLSVTLDAARTQAGSRTVAQLAFLAPSNAASAIVPLTLSQLSGTRLAGTTINNGRASSGRVIVVGTQPVLIADRSPLPGLTLYGWPGTNYWLESNPDVSNPGGWSNLLQIPLGGRSQRLEGLSTNQPVIFYRAR